MESRSTWHTSKDGKAKTESATIVLDGKEFTSGGAFVSPDYAVGYPDKGTLKAWDGSTLGTCRTVASWSMPINCWQGSRMYQIEATINGVLYTGRGFGDGMLWRGKRKRSR